MKPRILLRMAAVSMFVHVIGHTIGAATWKHAIEPAKQEVIRQMVEQRFPFMGTVRSMAEYYDGYGYASTLSLLLVVALLWILSDLADRNAAISAKILLPVSLYLLLLGIDETLFFFPFAAALSLLAALLGSLSFLTLKKRGVLR
jgi:hypothetical protein